LFLQEQNVDFIFDYLFEILKKDGELSKDEETPEHEKSYLRLESAIGITRLLSNKDFQIKLEVPQYVLLANVSQDKDEYVRSKFVLKFSKISKNPNAIYVGYVSLLVLFANDTKEITKNAKKGFEEAIKSRKEFIKSNPTIEHNSTLRTIYLPEYTLPYLVYLIGKVDSSSKRRVLKYFGLFYEVMNKSNCQFNVMDKMLAEIYSEIDAEDNFSSDHRYVAERFMEEFSKKNYEIGKRYR